MREQARSRRERAQRRAPDARESGASRRGGRSPLLAVLDPLLLEPGEVDAEHGLRRALDRDRVVARGAADRMDPVEELVLAPLALAQELDQQCRLLVAGGRLVVALDVLLRAPEQALDLHEARQRGVLRFLDGVRGAAALVRL